MKYVYIVSMIHVSKYKMDMPTSSIMGICSDFDHLEKAVLENAGDMFERMYNYAVIEKVKFGANAAYMRSEVISYYHINDQYVVEKCLEKPDKLNEQINWWANS